MFILNQTGTRLVKTEDLLDVLIHEEEDNVPVDLESGAAESILPSGKITIQATRSSFVGQSEKITLAAYESFDAARKDFLDLMVAIADGKLVFSFYPCGGNPPEKLTL